MGERKSSGVLAVLCAAFVLAAATPALAQGPCGGDFPSAGPITMKPGPPLRFGITPSGAAGQIGPASSGFAPDQPEQILASLAKLRPVGRPFVTHIYTSWGVSGQKEDDRLRGLVDLYTRNGYEVELVLRYKPRPEQEGDVAGFAEYVRHNVRLFGANRRVIAFQVTNEVNVTFSGDSSDGIFRGARDALIQGIRAGHDERERLGHKQLEMGFNWLYRTDESGEQDFWGYLRDKGGPAFVAALDWVGLDAYPGTYFPPEVQPGGERNFIVNAMSLLRECYMKIPAIPKTVPIHVQENGFPTGPGRSYERQAQMLESMVRAFHDFRGTYNVTDYRFFNMRDAETASPNFQQQFGMLRDDYTEKPAFGVYARLIAELAGPPVAEPPRSSEPDTDPSPRAACMPSRARVLSHGVGVARLGHSRQRLEARGARHGGVQAVRFCVRGGGVVRASLAGGRARLVATTARGHGVGRVRPGATLRSVLRAHPGTRRLARGLYLVRRPGHLVVGVARGRLRFVAVGERRVVSSVRALQAHLRRAGLN